MDRSEEAQGEGWEGVRIQPARLRARIFQLPPGPGPRRYSAAGPKPSPSVDGCAACAEAAPPDAPDASRRRAAGRSRSGGFREVAWAPGRGRYCSVRESRMRSSSSSPGARRRIHSCSCADSSMASRSCCVAPEHVARAWARAGRAGDRAGLRRCGLALRRGRAPAGQVKGRLKPLCPEGRGGRQRGALEHTGLATSRICESSQAAFGLGGRRATLAPGVNGGTVVSLGHGALPSWQWPDALWTGFDACSLCVEAGVGHRPLQEPSQAGAGTGLSLPATS